MDEVYLGFFQYECIAGVKGTRLAVIYLEIQLDDKYVAVYYTFTFLYVFKFS